MTKLTLFRKALAMLAMSLVSIAAIAENPKSPEIIVNNFDEPVLYRSISDNGKWAVVEVRPNYDGGKVINLADMSYVTITCPNSNGEYGRPLDVTDDGNTVVGTYGIEFYEQPAVWHRSTGKWEILSYDKSRFGGGHVEAVTPDGHWAVGRLMGKVNIFTEATALWDLTTGQIVETPGLPTPQLDTFNQAHNRFTQISPDGRYICANISPGGSVLYDRKEGKYFRPEGKLADGRTARLNVSGMSPSCRYIFGPASINGHSAYDEEEDAWSNYCLYDMTDGSVQLLRATDVSDFMIWGVADDGTLYAGAGGNGTPMRDFYIYAGGYWYALDQVLYQAYGIDYYVQTRLSNTGTPYAFSADGCTMASFTDPNRGEGWVMKVHEPFAEIVKRVDLLGAYEVSPKKDATMSNINQVRIGFDRNINIEGDASEVVLYGEDGSMIARALSVTAVNNIVTIVMRNRVLPDGKTFRLVIPAGFISMDGAASVKNKPIEILYHGRPAAPVKPEDEAVEKEYTLRCLDYTTNVITIPFDYELRLGEDVTAELLRAEDRVKVANLTLTVAGNVMSVKSAASVPLYRFSDYIVNIPAGVVTDLGGAASTCNEAFELLIHGNWEDEPTDDTILLSEDFNSGLGNKFMFWDGDRLEPDSEMWSWGFEADIPWWVVRDSNSSLDYAACSHAQYAYSGQSDDWMVARRMYIPDDKCRLLFDSQSYMPEMGDRLKVYAIPSDIIYNAVTQEAMEHFLENRVLIYDEEQDCGENIDTMEGEWLHNDISLAQFGGKYVYIAFVNDNKDASAVFLDNISVVHDLSMSMSVVSPESVVNATEYPVSVKLYMNSEALAFNDVELQLLDSDDKVVSTYTMPTTMTFDHDTPLEVTFAKPLPIEVGEETTYAVSVKAGDIASRFDRSVTSLLFQTTKHAVLEEYSGAQCGNCPDGIIVMEMLKKEFGDAFIPLSIRSYMGDDLTPENYNYSELLGLESLGAPSGVVNRRYGGYPVTYGEGNMIVPFTGDLDRGLWYDFVVNELSILADADIKASCKVNHSSQSIEVPVEVKFAVNHDHADYSLFGVLVEDQVQTRQSNFRSGSTDPFYGEWGAGGVFGKPQVIPYFCDDVVRNASHTNLVGTPGIIPSQIKAGEKYAHTLNVMIPARGVNLDNSRMVVMLIDNATGYIENVTETPIYSTSGVDVVAEDINFLVENGYIDILAAEDAKVSIYDLTGAILYSGTGSEHHIASPEGIVIIRIETSQGIVMKKISL